MGKKNRKSNKKNNETLKPDIAINSDSADSPDTLPPVEEETALIGKETASSDTETISDGVDGTNHDDTLDERIDAPSDMPPVAEPVAEHVNEQTDEYRAELRESEQAADSDIADNNEDYVGNEQDDTQIEENTILKRRKRIELYKKLIVFSAILLMLVPAVLCVIISGQVGGLKDEIAVLEASVEEYSQAASMAEAVNESEHQSLIEAALATEPATTQEETTERETASDYSELPEQERIKKVLAEGRKVVYLTFDDGPCANTEKLLDLLDSYNVKATFFINGYEGYEDQLNRMLDEGHSLGMHTYSHLPEIVYKSLSGFKNDVIKLQDYILEVTDYKSTIFRFPGGSSTEQSSVSMTRLINYLDSVGITYFDWNVSSGDGSDGLTSDDIYNNVMSGIEKNDISVVLMHDSLSRMTTYEAVSDIIESLQAMDALLLPITADTEPVHHNLS